jgi:hypothetical protein
LAVGDPGTTFFLPLYNMRGRVGDEEPSRDKAKQEGLKAEQDGLHCRRTLLSE